MNGHVKSMHFQQLKEPATTILSLLLVMAVDSTRAVAASRNEQCGNSLQQTLRLTRLVQKESVDLLKTYKASHGEFSELRYEESVSDIPDPNISGLEHSERIGNISTHLQAFLPHLQRVYEQQTDLQLPKSPLLLELSTVRGRSKMLAVLVHTLYRSLFPHLPSPQSAGGATTVPPPKHTFHQKIYGFAVLKTYRDFLSNVARELRLLKHNVCRGMTGINHSSSEDDLRLASDSLL